MQRNYENYLDFRRRDNVFLWASRELNPQVAYKQGRYRVTPRAHKEAVLNSANIQELLEVISKRQHVPKPQLENQVRAILDEIGYNKNLKLIRWLAIVLAKITTRVLAGVYANVDNVLQIKAAMGNCPVMFVPSHRSYGDFILMSFFCFSYGIEIPAIAAGMDFHGMYGMGKMLRDTGAFFMRRSFNDDSLYWTTFKQYVYQLVTRGDLPIEFFIEGTRSRSNKSLAPKYGLMAMVLKAFFLAQVPDILFVPISISYDRILEENLFAFELLGVPKPKETTSGFFKSLKILKENYGNVYMHLDDPISAKDVFGDSLDRSVHGMGPLHLQEITEQEKSLIPSLAYKIVRGQQKSTVITIFNVISLILNNNLSNRKELLTVSELTDEVLWLKGVLEFFGAFIPSEDISQSIKVNLDVHSNLINLTADNKVGLVSSEVVLDKNPTKLKAHCLSNETMSYSVPFVLLQIYTNPTLHFLVDAALLVIILRTKNNLNIDEFYTDYHFLRSLFSMEFVIFAPWEKMEFETALQKSTGIKLVNHTSNSEYRLGDNGSLQDFLFTIFKPFFISYWIVCVILERSPRVCQEKIILTNVQIVVEKKINDADGFIHPYCLNLDTLGNCLSSLSSMGVVKKNKSDNKVVYEINKEELRSIREHIEMYIPECNFREFSVNKMQLQNKL